MNYSTPNTYTRRPYVGNILSKTPMENILAPTPAPPGPRIVYNALGSVTMITPRPNISTIKKYKGLSYCQNNSQNMRTAMGDRSAKHQVGVTRPVDTTIPGSRPKLPKFSYMGGNISSVIDMSCEDADGFCRRQPISQIGAPSDFRSNRKHTKTSKKIPSKPIDHKQYLHPLASKSLNQKMFVMLDDDIEKRDERIAQRQLEKLEQTQSPFDFNDPEIDNENDDALKVEQHDSYDLQHAVGDAKNTGKYMNFSVENIEEKKKRNARKGRQSHTTEKDVVHQEISENTDSLYTNPSAFVFYKPSQIFDTENIAPVTSENLVYLNYKFAVRCTSHGARQFHRAMMKLHPSQEPREFDMIVNLGYVKTSESSEESLRDSPPPYDVDSLEFYADKSLRKIGTPLCLLVSSTSMSSHRECRENIGMTQVTMDHICAAFDVTRLSQIGSLFENLVSKGEVQLSNEEIRALRRAKIASQC